MKRELIQQSIYTINNVGSKAAYEFITDGIVDELSDAIKSLEVDSDEYNYAQELYGSLVSVIEAYDEHSIDLMRIGQLKRLSSFYKEEVRDADTDFPVFYWEVELGNASLKVREQMESTGWLMNASMSLSGSEVYSVDNYKVNDSTGRMIDSPRFPRELVYFIYKYIVQN